MQDNDAAKTNAEVGNGDPPGSRAPRRETPLNEVVAQVDEFNKVHPPLGNPC